MHFHTLSQQTEVADCHRNVRFQDFIMMSIEGLDVQYLSSYEMFITVLNGTFTALFLHYPIVETLGGTYDYC